MQHESRTIRSLPEGIVVSVDMGLYRHPGILTEARPTSERSVISASWRLQSVAEEPVSQFAAGRTLRVEGYLGELPPEQVLIRARAALGEPYDLFTRNCEHFVRYAHGLVPKSPQLLTAAGIAAIFLITLAAISRSR